MIIHLNVDVFVRAVPRHLFLWAHLRMSVSFILEEDLRYDVQREFVSFQATIDSRSIRVFFLCEDLCYVI